MASMATTRATHGTIQRPRLIARSNAALGPSMITIGMKLMTMITLAVRTDRITTPPPPMTMRLRSRKWCRTRPK